MEREITIVIVSDRYEVHPTVGGGYAVVSTLTGEVVARFTSAAAAIAAAEKLQEVCGD